MMEKINLRVASSTAFLELVGKKMMQINEAEALAAEDSDGEDCDIWALCELDERDGVENEIEQQLIK